MNNDAAEARPMPAGLPLLAPGAHLFPEDGSCLMEYVSVLAAEPFSDHPRCTDPLLAELARLVNDATSDRGRQALGRLAPNLAAASRGGAIEAASLVLGTLMHALDATGGSRLLRRQIRRAQRHLRCAEDQGPGGRWTRWLEVAHRHGPGRRRLTAAVQATGRLPENERDAVLHAMLSDALASNRCARQTSLTPLREPDGSLATTIAVGVEGSSSALREWWPGEVRRTVR